jgi:hypothetical protein
VRRPRTDRNCVGMPCLRSSEAMRILVTSIVVAVLLAAGAGLILSTMQRPVYEVQAGPSVRLDDPGYNLVGPGWNGLGRANEPEAKVSRMNEQMN